MTADYKISKFILNLITEIQKINNKHKNHRLELNSYTLKYIESYLTSFTMSSSLTAPVRKSDNGTTLLGKKITINETLKNGQICIMPSNTTINV